MKRVAQAAILLILVLSTMRLEAAWQQPEWLCGDLDLGAEVIYWKTLVSPHMVGEQRVGDGANIQEDRRFQFGNDYDWGIRAKAGYSYCDWIFEANYTWFQSVDRFQRRSNVLDLLAIDGGALGSGLRGLLVFTYNSVDVRISDLVFCQPCYQLQFFINGGYLALTRYHRSTLYAPVESFAQAFTYDSFRGGFVGVGSRFDANLWCGFCGFLEANPGLVVGRRGHYFESNSVAVPVIKNRLDRETALTPGVRTRIGLSLCRDYCGIEVEAELGYQLDYYWHILINDSEQRIFTNIDCGSVGFGGPFFGLKGRF